MKQDLLQIKGYKIDPIIFELRFEKSSPDHCLGLCCKSGVWVSLNEKNTILDHKDLIKQFMDQTQTKDETIWFENNITSDEDFPEGLCDSTNVFNDKCVFLNKEFKCVLQIAAVENGFDIFKFKPYFCITFPVVISQHTITYDDFLLDIAPCCSAKKSNNPNFIECCKMELLHIIGKDGYIKLKEIEKSYKNERIRK